MKITCPECGTVNTTPEVIPSWTQLRCGKCGAAIPDKLDSSTPGTELQSVKARLLSIEHRMSVLERRMRSVTGEIGIEPAAIPDTQPGEPYVEKIAERVVVLEDRPIARHMDAEVKSAPSQAPSRVEPHPPSQRITPPSPPRKAAEPPRFAGTLEKWEQALPGNWLSRIGVVALLIGLGFLAKLAYDYHWISPVVQLLLGLLFGGALLWGGQHWGKRYPVWAQALTGGGIGVLYISFFASYHLNNMMGFFPTYALMFLTTALAVWLALRQESMAIAIIGIAGAFLVPIILGASALSRHGADTTSHPGLLIAYILVLDAGILWLSTLRNWRWFTLLGWIGSLAVYGLWYRESGHDSSPFAVEGTLTAIFVFFAAATTLFHLIQRRVPKPTDLSLMSLNAAAYFGISYHILWHGYHGWLGLFSFLLAGFYGVLGYIALQRNKENRTLSYFAFGIAIVFLTVAIPVQLHRSLITVAWAAEGAVLIWISSRQGLRQLQLCGLGVLALVLIRLFAFDRIVDQESFRPVLDNMFLPFAMSIVAFYAAAYFLRRDPKVLQPWLVPLMVLLANFLTIFLFSSEIVNYVDSRIIAARADNAEFTHIRNLENARALSLVGLWAAYGIGLVTAGFWRGWSWLRAGGYPLLAIAAVTTLVALNYSHAVIHSGISTPVLNYSFGAFAVCVGAFFLSAYVISKNNNKLHELEKGLFPALLISANILALWALSSEIYTFVHSGDPRNNLRTLSLIILWAACGLALLLDGTQRGWTWSRVGGYALMVLAAGTALVEMNYSHAMIHRGISTPVLNYSFGAFAVCVIVFYLSAYVIAKQKDKLYDFESQLLPAFVIAANFLTLWALSSEIFTFVHSGDIRDNARTLSLIALWAAYGFGLLEIGIRKNWGLGRAGGYALMVLAAGTTLVMLNYHHAEIHRGVSTPVFNYSFGAFALSVIVFYLSAWWIARNTDKLYEPEKMLPAALIVGANFLTLWAFSSEVLYFVSGNGGRMWLTLLWAAYGLVLVAVGIAGKWRWVRLGGLAFVSVAIIKLFAIDTFTLHGGYRVAAFLTLGVLLLAGGFAYHKYANIIKGFIFDQPTQQVNSGQDEVV
jgi:uncharacterized membrane protein